MSDNETRYSPERTANLLMAYKNADTKHNWFSGQNLVSAALFGQFFYETNFRYKTAAGKIYILIFTSDKLAHRVLKDGFALTFPIIKPILIDQAIRIATDERLDGLIFDYSQIDFNLTIQDYENNVLKRIQLLNQSLKNDQLLKENAVTINEKITETIADKISFLVPGRILLDKQKQLHHSYITLHNSSDQTKWVSVFTDIENLKEWSKASFAENFHDESISVFLMSKKELLDSQANGDFHLTEDIDADGIVIDAPQRAGMGQIVELKGEK
ncbi:hypothetical protein [Oenococcus sicerae]|uniref:hypothetical protein n=1 Tax=Oenococcus sicerae TaxID=2203724 RepID=UPI0039E80CB9